MRFRSFGLSASNMKEYISKLKEKENKYLEESTLAQIDLLNLEEKSDNSDEYDLLGPKSNYKLTKFEKKRLKRKTRRMSDYYFRKKFVFYHKRKRINSESITIIKTTILE